MGQPCCLGVIAVLLLAVLLPSCARPYHNYGHAHEGPLACGSDSQLQGAEEIYNGWIARAAQCLAAIENRTCSDKEHGLGWLTQEKRYCGYKLSFSSQNRTFTFNPADHETCDHPGLQDRVPILTVTLNHLVQNLPAQFAHLRQLPDFEFYYFPRDGSPTDDLLRCHLGLPVLVAGISHSDRCGLPVPHPHFQVAMVAHYGLSNNLTDALGGRAEASKAGEYLLSKYQHGHSQPFVPWDKRIPKLMYRGGCTLAHDPDDHEIGKWVYVRPQLCNISTTAGIAEPYIDVGIAMEDDHPDWQKDCLICRRPGIPFTEWVKARYQIVAEGFGPSYDATDMKFLSGGVVMWPLFEGYQDHLYYAWYQPLLKSGYNYFQPQINEVGSLVIACEKHMKQQCMEVALRSYQTYSCKVTIDSAAFYMLKLIEKLASWRQPDWDLQASLPAGLPTNAGWFGWLTSFLPNQARSRA